MRYVWVRLGDADNYNGFDNLADAAEYMALFGVKHVHRSRKFAVEAVGLTGHNDISLFHGDDAAQPTGELSTKDVHFINSELRRHDRRTS